MIRSPLPCVLTGERGSGGEGTRMGTQHQHRSNGQTLAWREFASDKSANKNDSLIQAQVRPSPPTPLPRVRGRGELNASRVTIQDSRLPSRWCRFSYHRSVFGIDDQNR